MKDWKMDKNAMIRNFKFKDFKEAFAFMTEVAMHAESHNHHPDWSNVYNKVRIKLSTHDAGDIVTEKDRNLAREIDAIFLKYQG